MSNIIKFFQCLLCWRVRASPEEKIRTADVVIGLAFGAREDGPGKSNEALAEIAKKLHEKYELPLVLQWEIVGGLVGTDIREMVKLEIINHRTLGKYLDTLEVISQAKEFCERHGWKRAIILAHPDHVWRCVMVAEKLGFDVIVVDTSRVPYDKLSIQFWTGSSLVFIPRDVVARIAYLLAGNI